MYNQAAPLLSPGRIPPREISPPERYPPPRRMRSYARIYTIDGLRYLTKLWLCSPCYSQATRTDKRDR